MIAILRNWFLALSRREQWLVGIAGGLAAWRAWRRRDTTAREQLLCRAAVIGLVLVALHSLGDYPLRKTAMLAAAGLLAGCVATVPGREKAALPARGAGRNVDPAFNP